MGEPDDLAEATRQARERALAPKRPPTREERFVKKQMELEEGKLVGAIALFVLLLIAWLLTKF